MRCDRCKASTPAGSRFCPACGAALDPANAPTVTSDELTPAGAETDDEPSGARPPRAHAGRWLTGSGSIDHGRFAPGTILDRRYRVVGLIGRGGMGEVYRADDLRLGQPVALKLLPRGLVHDARRLEQFHNEVRTAREVAHPNVCRVYDIGGSEPQLYLSMEYVDGEDLAASLRRVGRFPEERALDLARQICAGLAAVHDRGVVHRDLKPANIMLDAAGRVRLMDFGLAAMGAVTGTRAGTPAYMAPEQLEGAEATPKSDIFALGLVLYELFTGRRVFEATNLDDLAAAHASGDITPPTDFVRGLDPRIERAILRCLDREPARRPAALAVSMLLPGGDPLAAALAAGETPSPEMVAAAGAENAVLSGNAALAWMVATLVGLAGVGWLAGRSTVVGQSDLRKPAVVLAERAEEIRLAAGGDRDPVDRATGFEYDRAALAWYADHGGPADEWRGLARGRPAALRFWYRTGHRHLDPADPGSPVTSVDPPLSAPGDTLIELDPEGKLLRLVVLPPSSIRELPAAASQDGTALFRYAGLEPAAFAPLQAEAVPPTYADDVRAWRGELPDLPGVPVQIEAASLRGRVVSFEVVGPWAPAAARTTASRAQFAGALATALVVAGLVVLMLALAVVNLRVGRADWRRASRLAVLGFTVELIRWLVLPAHAADPSREVARFLNGTASAFLYGGVLGAAYLGFEPYVRRYWPNVLISWMRAAGGRFRDPLVGRDVLVGLTWGLFNAILNMTYQAVPQLVGWPSPPGWLVWLGPLAGTAMVFVILTMTINLSLVNGLVATFVITLVRRYGRSIWIVTPVSMIVFGVLGDPTFTIEGGGMGVQVFWIATAFVPVIVTIRYGLLAVFAAALSSNLTANAAFTLDPDRAYFQASLISAAAILAFALVGWRLARGGEPLLGSRRADKPESRRAGLSGLPRGQA